MFIFRRSGPRESGRRLAILLIIRFVFARPMRPSCPEQARSHGDATEFHRDETHRETTLEGLLHLRLFPRIPRQIGLRFACDEAPVDYGNMVLRRNWQNCVERAAHFRHVFRA